MGIAQTLFLKIHKRCQNHITKEDTKTLSFDTKIVYIPKYQNT